MHVNVVRQLIERLLTTVRDIFNAQLNATAAALSKRFLVSQPPPPPLRFSPFGFRRRSAGSRRRA
jgi:hypothetical protein